MNSFIRATILTILMLLGTSIPAFAETSPTQSAIVQLISKETKATVSMSDIVRIVSAVFKETKKHGIDPFLMISVIKTESTYRPGARNKSGARGLTQVVPRWHRDKIKGRNIMNIETNIEVGTQIFADCLARNEGNVKKASRCYSGNASNYASKLKAGHNEVRKADVLYRFENELPLVVNSSFDSPSTFSISVSPATIPAIEPSPERLVVAASSIYSNPVVSNPLTKM